MASSDGINRETCLIWVADIGTKQGPLRRQLVLKFLK